MLKITKDVVYGHQIKFDYVIEKLEKIEWLIINIYYRLIKEWIIYLFLIILKSN